MAKAKKTKLLMNNYKKQWKATYKQCLHDPFNTLALMSLFETVLAYRRDYYALNYKTTYDAALFYTTKACDTLDQYYSGLADISEYLNNKEEEIDVLKVQEVDTKWQVFWTIVKDNLRGWTL